MVFFITVFICISVLIIIIKGSELLVENDAKFDPEVNKLVQYVLKGVENGTIEYCHSRIFKESSSQTKINIWFHSNEYHVKKGTYSEVIYSNKRPSLYNKVKLKRLLNRLN